HPAVLDLPRPRRLRAGGGRARHRHRCRRARPASRRSGATIAAHAVAGRPRGARPGDLRGSLWQPRDQPLRRCVPSSRRFHYSRGDAHPRHRHELRRRRARNPGGRGEQLAPGRDRRARGVGARARRRRRGDGGPPGDMRVDVDETNPLPWSPEYVPTTQPKARQADRPLLHLLLLAATLVTTTMAGTRIAGLEPTSLRALAAGLPFSITLLAILLTHESGHYLMCRRHRIVASLPYVLPAPFFPLGTFGAVIRVRSRFPDRRALFDMGAAGPWAGFVVALVAMVIGLRLSTVGGPVPEGPTILLGDSLLTSFLARIVLHAEPDTVMLHPLAFAAWAGMLVTSLNL